MELLRKFDFDALETALASMYSDGMKDSEVSASLMAYLLGDDQGQPRWMTFADGFYWHAMQETDEAERSYLIGEAQHILLSRNAVM